MNKMVAATAAAAIGLALMSPTANAQSQVLVALLDMSAMIGMGTVNMMGPGMMGQGYGMMGPGMMGQGYGMMNPGMMGQGYGMMGPGMMMMGLMTIRVGEDTVKAGDVSFDVTNWSRSAVHEMIVVAGSATQLPYDYSQAKVREDQIKVLGETGELKPGESKNVQLRLDPGTYILLCNIPGHYGAGMATTLSVTP